MTETISPTHQIKLNLRPSDYERIRVIAEAAGMPMSTWVRARLLEALARLDPSDERSEFERDLVNANKVLNAEVDQLLRERDKLRERVKKLGGGR